MSFSASFSSRVGRWAEATADEVFHAMVKESVQGVPPAAYGWRVRPSTAFLGGR